MTIINNIIALSERPSELEVLTALTNLLAVINPDKDGGWFICEQARWTIDEAKAVVHNRIHGE